MLSALAYSSPDSRMCCDARGISGSNETIPDARNHAMQLVRVVAFLEASRKAPNIRNLSKSVFLRLFGSRIAHEDVELD
jgi:hypothetical protein